MKKAQAAMEFLMTYGWPILVVLIALGALFYFGVFCPDNFYTNCFCSYTDYNDMSEHINIDGINYVQCSKLKAYIDYEQEKILFNEESKLFYCGDNKTLIPVT